MIPPADDQTVPNGGAEFYPFGSVPVSAILSIAEPPHFGHTTETDASSGGFPIFQSRAVDRETVLANRQTDAVWPQDEHLAFITASSRRFQSSPQERSPSLIGRTKSRR